MLPASTAAADQPFAHVSKPLAFKDQNGRPATIEELIVRHERKEVPAPAPFPNDARETKGPTDRFLGPGYRGKASHVALQVACVGGSHSSPCWTLQASVLATLCQLLETPVMLDLIERKWLYFAGDLYRNRFLTFAAVRS